MSDFQLPPKERKVIPILRPGIGAKQAEAREPTQTTSTFTGDGNVAASALKLMQETSSVQRLRVDTTQKPRELESKPRQLKSLNTALSLSQQPSIQSPLDVYSRNYVPLWLRAVNESHATLHPCPPFPLQDFVSYIGTFVGPNFVRPISPVRLPQPVPVTVVEQDISIANYSSFWQAHLQNEFAAQSVQQKTFSIYSQRLHPVENTEDLYVVQIPGLRENAPQIDLADVIHVRPLIPRQALIDSQVQDWLSYGRHHGYPSPGFTGFLYDPQVWQIDRFKETVKLRIKAFDSSLDCNMTFPLQEPKLEPLYRAAQISVRGNAWMRNVLFPEADSSVIQTALSPAEFEIEWIDNLNREQKKAVHSVISANYGRLPYLISGPPGTGKTKTLVEIALQMLQKPGHILICAPSDAAADTLALRLSMHLKPSELLRLNALTRTFAEVPDRLLLYTHSSDSLFSLPPVEQLLSFRIVVTTCRDADLLNCARLDNTSLQGLMDGVQRIISPHSTDVPLHWTALLLDEAAQATEPEVLIPLSVIMPPHQRQFPQFVAAGDQYQLGPRLLGSSKLAISLFERLFDRAVYSKHPLSRAAGVKFLSAKMLPMMRPPFANLIRNYRSHPAILSVPSALFYSNTLIPERRTSQEILNWPGWPSKYNWPVMFHQNESPDEYESILAGDGTGVGTLFNAGESTIAMKIAQSLLQSTNQAKDVLKQREIMVMSPFRAQVTQLRRAFRQQGLFDVNIGPLEAFQGLESRIVIICTTRTRIGLGARGQDAGHHVSIDKSRSLGIIDESRRFNVAMTRAQEGLIVVGNAHCLVSTGDKSWLEFLHFCRRNNCFEAPAEFKWPDLGDDHRQGSLERGLIYAALGEAEARQERNHTTSGTNGVVKTASGFKLKGPRKDMDEEMWQFKELAQLHDSELIDPVAPDHSQWNTTGTPDLNGSPSIEHETTDPGYDRDLRQEFYEECNTQ